MPKRKEVVNKSVISAKRGRRTGPTGSDSGSTSSKIDKDIDKDKDKNNGVLMVEEAVDVEEGFDLYPGLQSRKRLDDLFNNKGKNGLSQLSNEDLIKAEEEMRKFLDPSTTSTKQKACKDDEKEKRLTSKSKRNTKKVKANGDGKSKPVDKMVDLDLSFDTNDLLRESEELLASISGRETSSPSPSSSNITQPEVSLTTSTSTNKLYRRSNTLRSNKKDDTDNLPCSSNGTKVVEEIVISDTEEDLQCVRNVKISKGKRNQRAKKKRKKGETTTIEVQEISDDESEVDLGHILLFHAELKSDRFPIRMYEKQYVRELRAMVAEKTKSHVEMLQMFLGDCVQLEDDKTLVESGIDNLCTVEIFLIYKSEKDLYEDGSTSVFKFKLQTEDRRGRQDAYVFVSRSGQMRSAIEQYAKELGISSSGMKLHFDGDEINLSLTPEECDLEGGECLDLQVQV